MGLGREWIADHQFEYDFPHGVPGGPWSTQDGRKLHLFEMTTPHLLNCMKMIGKRDPRYSEFEEELQRREQRLSYLGIRV